MKKVTFALLVSLALQACTANHSASQVAAQTEPQAHNHNHLTGDKVPPAVHGMVLFGENEVYASHIPMFKVPHDWQALFKVTLSHPNVDAMAVYLKARGQATAAGQTQTLVTLQPKPFVLPPLLEGKLQTFEADLYLGNFEDGGKQLLQGVTVKVEKVLAVQHLELGNQPLATLHYYHLKDGASSYLVHKISAPDNFDQILEVKWLNQAAQPADEVLPIFDFASADTLESKPKIGQTFTLTPDGQWVASTGDGTGDLQIISAFYCTVGPGFFQACE